MDQGLGIGEISVKQPSMNNHVLFHKWEKRGKIGIELNSRALLMSSKNEFQKDMGGGK